MWKPFLFENCNYLIKYRNERIIRIYLTDFRNLWMEEIVTDKLIERFKDLNPLFDISSLSSEAILSKIFVIIDELKSSTIITLSNIEPNVNLELKYKLGDFFIKCKFYFIQSDSSVYFNEFTLPLLQSVQYLEMRERKLFELLEKKDKEIQEHELLGSQISRQHLITKKFNRNEFMENNPNGLFVNVFLKSRAFLDNFAKNFGLIKYSTSKIKIEGEIDSKKIKLA